MVKFVFKQLNFNLNWPNRRWYLTTVHLPQGRTVVRVVAPSPAPTRALPSAPARRQLWRPFSPPHRPERAVALGVLALAPSGWVLPPPMEPATVSNRADQMRTWILHNAHTHASSSMRICPCIDDICLSSCRIHQPRPHTLARFPHQFGVGLRLQSPAAEV
jgi:hypothetical protein